MTITKDINNSVLENFFIKVSIMEIKSFDEISSSIEIVRNLLNYGKKNIAIKKNSVESFSA